MFFCCVQENHSECDLKWPLMCLFITLKTIVLFCFSLSVFCIWKSCNFHHSRECQRGTPCYNKTCTLYTDFSTYQFSMLLLWWEFADMLGKYAFNEILSCFLLSTLLELRGCPPLKWFNFFMTMNNGVFVLISKNWRKSWFRCEGEDFWVDTVNRTALLAF